MVPKGSCSCQKQRDLISWWDFHHSPPNLPCDVSQAFSNFLDSSNLRNVATCPYVYKQFSSKR